MYNSWHLVKAEEDFKTKKAPAPLGFDGSPMAQWYFKKQNQAYIEAIVGKPAGPLSKGATP
jgi:hypothetical protein